MNENVRLVTIGGGALLGIFDKSLEKVLEDIADDGKVPDAARTITLTIRVIPDKTRSMSLVECSSSEKFAPQIKSKGVLYHQLTDEGILTAETTDPYQQNLFGLEPPEEKINHVR